MKTYWSSSPRIPEREITENMGLIRTIDAYLIKRDKETAFIAIANITLNSSGFIIATK